MWYSIIVIRVVGPGVFGTRAFRPKPWVNLLIFLTSPLSFLLFLIGFLQTHEQDIILIWRIFCLAQSSRISDLTVVFNTLAIFLSSGMEGFSFCPFSNLHKYILEMPTAIAKFS